MRKPDKVRLDELLVRLALAENKARAQRVIMAGLVRVNGMVATKAGHKFQDDVEVTVEAQPRFVSRGGDKLEGAFAAFEWLNVSEMVCLDVGASTGGFTDCLLQHGAARVIALDVGKGQLHWRLRQDPRVHVIEGFNARFLRMEDLPEQPGMAVADTSFISLKLILPPIVDVLPTHSAIITLIKPQFEAGREHTPRGVVRDPAVRQAVVEEIKLFGESALGLEWRGCVESPLKGADGNVEFLAGWRKLPSPPG